jgi:hypothetical protein
MIVEILKKWKSSVRGFPTRWASLHLVNRFIGMSMIRNLSGRIRTKFDRLQRGASLLKGTVYWEFIFFREIEPRGLFDLGYVKLVEEKKYKEADAWIEELDKKFVSFLRLNCVGWGNYIAKVLKSGYCLRKMLIMAHTLPMVGTSYDL